MPGTLPQAKRLIQLPRRNEAEPARGCSHPTRAASSVRFGRWLFVAYLLKQLQAQQGLFECR